MRNATASLTSALVLAAAVSASAQATLPKPTDPRELNAATIGGRFFGTLDFGGRFTDINGDEARYRRYRDLRDGPFAPRLSIGRRTADWTLDARAENVGYRDQRYQLVYRQVGRLRATFLWDQIPLFISSDTRSFYTQVSPGVFRLEDTMQSQNQAGLTTIRNYIGTTTELDLRTRRDIGLLDVLFNATRDMDLKFTVTSANRTGSIPYGAPFGFNNLIELPVPIDSRTTNANTALEWSNQRALVRVGWDGSWYENAVETLIWDNPLKITDAPSYSSAYSDGRGPSQARMALWPDNTQQYIHGTGSVATPGRGRLTGYVAIGQANQNAPLLSHTINTQIPEIPLERGTAEAEIRNTMFNLQYTARPTNRVGVVARYRHADVENRTPHFETFGRVRFDGVLDDAANSPEPEPYSVKRKNFDVDATFNVLPLTAVKVGYGNAIADRTFRHFEETSEHVFRASLDTTGHELFSFRALFESGSREGDGLELHVLEAVGEQPGMRHYDIADRDRTRFTVLATLTPNKWLGFNASAGVGREEYPNADLGLQNYDSDQFSVGVDFVPNDQVGFNTTLAWEKYDSIQRSRYIATPGVGQEVDAARNWMTDYDGRIFNIDATLDLAEIAPRTAFRFNVNWSDADDTYNYQLASGSPIAAPLPLAPVVNQLLRSTADVTYKITSRLLLGASYWFEDYDVEDFALGPDIASEIVLPPVVQGLPISPTNTVLLGYIYRPYTANTGIVRLTYLW